MTSGRFAPFFAGLLLLTTAGCGGEAPRCTECPAVEGRYRLQFDTSGGVPPECALLGVEVPTGEVLDIARSGENLTSRLAGVPVRGTITSQGTFVMTGTGVPSANRTDTLTLTGTYLAPLADGGTASINGVLTGSYARASDTGGQRCNVSSPFSATRD
ncbi:MULTISPECIES: hypothetical protein [Myxococcus]|uniref:Lipoprotein n=1 Tax=Myxococcus virescens TaxID=83456 RepID=A0A511HBN3_9BACT|nr:MULTISPECIES: hypothetical protein [Myxococcus]WNZ58808.1 hypothetical protein QEG98_21935 [Myxococcus sp. MxC21-1]GEL70834.1 hypothetical protein MVI01_26180 [Myxococcus virescens]SDE22386.1 hypothetical protein SAMN04488504_105107 [Myxococcus virescens]